MILSAILAALTPINILLCLAGVVSGTIIGALPGLSATMAVAVLVPFTFSMPTTTALILLGAIYTGAIYGGSYAAILVNTPGTPSSIATTFDGFPMAKKGKGALAITCATYASVCGGLVGALFLLTLAPLLAHVAIKFGPVEYFWLAIFGLTLISSLSEGSNLKGFAGAAFGLLISTIGAGTMAGDLRYTFGSTLLLGGVDVVAALIGLYCIPVLFDLILEKAQHLEPASNTEGYHLKEAAKLAWRERFNLIRSSVIGTIVGILPGAGGSVASLIAYSEAKRSSPRRKEFGKGEPGGVFATESANNATVGGGFIPTLVLGIPGTPPDAVILGALMIQGVKTGPALFTEQGATVYIFIFGLLFATILMLPVGLFIGRHAYRSISTVSKTVLVPIIAFMCILGTFAIQNSTGDVFIMIVIGCISWLLIRFGFPPSPIVLGIILGPIAEAGFVQGMMIGEASGSVLTSFFARPISLCIIAMSIFTLSYPWIAARRAKKSEEQDGGCVNE